MINKKRIVAILALALVLAGISCFLYDKANPDTNARTLSSEAIRDLLKMDNFKLTWKNYDGTGDPATAIYVLSGVELGAGDTGLDTLRMLIPRMPKGAQILLIPYYGDPGGSVRRKYPFSVHEFSDYGKKYQVSLNIPCAG